MMAPPKTTKACKKNTTKKQNTPMKISKRRTRKTQFGVEDYGRTKTPPILDCLPTEMIIEVLTRVAASSPFDFFQCKLSCKALKEICEEKEIMQKISLDSLLDPCFWPQNRDSNNGRAFLLRCLDFNNPNALLLMGLVEYFGGTKVEEGIIKLENATEQGNKEAGYVLGLLLVCNGEEKCIKKGVGLLLSIMKAVRGKGIMECRKKLSDILRKIWVFNKPTAKSKPRIACAQQQQHEVQDTWKRIGYYCEDSEDSVVCESCKVAREINFFFSILGE